LILSKKKIEDGAVSFNDKLETLIPKMLNNESFWQNLETEKTHVKELYSNRKNIIHLKTNAEDDLTVYFNVIEMLDLVIFNSINATTKFMNSAKKDFVEFEK
jgi:hypothetical protein